jgi:hypothetical protein
MQEKITQSEWIIIVIVLGLIALLGAISYSGSTLVKSRRQAQTSAGPRQKQVIEISIEGAVENPGTFYLQPGCSLKDVLKIACLSKGADRKNLNFEKIIYKSVKITIPSKPPSKKRERKEKLEIKKGRR